MQSNSTWIFCVDAVDQQQTVSSELTFEGSESQRLLVGRPTGSFMLDVWCGSWCRPCFLPGGFAAVNPVSWETPWNLHIAVYLAEQKHGLQGWGGYYDPDCCRLTLGKRLKLYNHTSILVFFDTCGLNPNEVCPEGGAGGKVNLNQEVYSLYGDHFRTPLTLEPQLYLDQLSSV